LELSILKKSLLSLHVVVGAGVAARWIGEISLDDENIKFASLILKRQI